MDKVVKSVPVEKDSSLKRPSIDQLLDQSIAGSGLPQFLRKKLVFREATHSESLKGLVTSNSGDSTTNSSTSSYVSYKRSATKQNEAFKSNKSNELMNSDENERDLKFGFIAPEVDLFSKERLEPFLKWSRIRSIGPGLSNMGNTCFLNSVLQCLFYTVPLAEFSLSREHSKRCRASRDEFCGLCVLERLLTKVHDRQDEAVIRPVELVSRLKAIGKHFRPGRQEDSHEFLRLFIETMQKSALPFNDSATPNISQLNVRSKETSVIHRIFGGHLQSTVTCSTCKHVSRTFDHFLDLSLDINKADSLEAALKVFTTPELLSKGNRYRCEACHRLVEAHKQFSIYKTPEILTVQLKRFSVNPFTGQTGKVSRPVAFSEYLNLKQWTSGISQDSIMYRLYAVIVHEGNSCNSGHYHAFVRNSNDIWYSMNDSSVHQVGLETVLRQRAYILFYQKQHQNPKNSEPKNTEAKQQKVHETNKPPIRSMEEKMEAVRAASRAYTQDKMDHQQQPSHQQPKQQQQQQQQQKEEESQSPVPQLVQSSSVLRASSMWHMTVVDPVALNHPSISCKRIKSNFYNSWRVDKISR
jgi:ubiquitin C-terminal hydrolase